MITYESTKSMVDISVDRLYKMLDYMKEFGYNNNQEVILKDCIETINTSINDYIEEVEGRGT